jgi:selenocysteine lyase/cysteine desulfurase
MYASHVSDSHLLQAYATRAGANIFEVTVPFPVSSSEQILRTFEETLVREKHDNPTQRIRLAVFDHIVSMPTMILPISKLVKLCRSYGVEQIFIDGAHGIGNLNLDMQEIGADYYMSNVHKWMFAPSTAAFIQ